MKRGSALLIVLGMVAFMVISAVAFSAYMRASRLPSSYLRRTSSSRLLVKAALAEAIDELDIAIGNDLYPGMGDKGRLYQSPRSASNGTTTDSRRRNYWRAGCFIGTNTLEETGNTVSTLCVEGLAYLPFNMINEARYFSRRSRAATWKTFAFDSGRYAFSAFDVSGYFDVNRISANVGRNSSDNGRVSLAYAFENANHDGYETNPADWETFMDKFVDATKARDEKNAGRMPAKDGLVPLVSLADLNLAIGNGSSAYGCPSTLVSPFCRYIANGADFVTSAGDDEAQRLRNMTFVTDSYFPSTTASASASDSDSSGSSTTDDDDYDLNDEEAQPFDTAMLKAETSSATLMSAMNPTRKSGTRLMDSMCGLDLAALWDYLDVDAVPLSLAIPTTERVPMICGIQSSFGAGKLTLTESKAAPSATGVKPLHASSTFAVIDHNNDAGVCDGSDTCGAQKGGGSVLSRTVQQVTEYKLTPADVAAFFQPASFRLGALVAFPFRRNATELNGTFTLGGYLTLALVEGNEAFHLGSSSVLNLSDALKKNASSPALNDGVFYVPLAEKSISLPKTLDKAEDAVSMYSFTSASAASTASSAFSTPMYTITKQWVETRKYNSKTDTYSDWTPGDETIVAAQCNMPPLTSDGVVDPQYSDAGKFKALVEGKQGTGVRLQASVWFYVKDGSKYVDLVPACLADDNALNGVNSYNSFPSSVADQMSGKPYPLMNFYGKSFSYNPTTLVDDLAQDPNFGIATSSTLFCPDPRWNWAPEHWYAPNGADFSASGWLAECGVGTDGRDRDIFMATSDAGYLQSVYELAFLPRLSNMENRGNSSFYGNMSAVGSGRPTFPTTKADVLNYGLMWQTFRPFAVNGSARDDFEGVGFTFGGTGARVDPYGSKQTLMAAFANTPCNWSVAATNPSSPMAIQGSAREAEDYNKNYCFNKMATSSDSKFEWTDLEGIAQNMYAKVRDLQAQTGDDADDWTTAFDKLDWAGDAFGAGDGTFAGVTLSGDTCELADVDKKFLYGYWRDCFAAKQQLFIVFVRAEPLMMGGGSIGQTPPQLGARAVALVWRDPNRTTEDVGGQPRPHRTRVLFYRQFE